MTVLGIIAGCCFVGFLVLWISAARRIARAEFGERYRREFGAGKTSETFEAWEKRTGAGDAGRTSEGSGASAGDGRGTLPNPQRCARCHRHHLRSDSLLCDACAEEMEGGANFVTSEPARAAARKKGGAL